MRGFGVRWAAGPAGRPHFATAANSVGALAHHIVDELPQLRNHTVYAAGHRIEIRSSFMTLDGVTKSMSPAGRVTLWALAHQAGRVVSRDDLLAALPGNGNSTHAVETAMLRLRTALGGKKIVATTVKRRHRLAGDQVDG